MKKCTFFACAHTTLGRLASLAFVWSCLYVSAVAQQFGGAGANNTTLNIYRAGNVAIGTTSASTHTLEANKLNAGNFAGRFRNSDVAGLGLSVFAGSSTATSPTDVWRAGSFNAGGNEVVGMVLRSNGKLGIGTETPHPQTRLSFTEGMAMLGGVNTYWQYVPDYGDYPSAAFWGRNIYRDLSTYKWIGAGVGSAYSGIALQDNGGIAFYTGLMPDVSNYNMYDSLAMRIDNQMRVQIGYFTDSGSYRLAVRGKIAACDEIRVFNKQVSFLPDYVFQPGYRLRPLHEVEAYVQQHSHLPEVPSAVEVARDGLGLVEMSATLLKKVEELTLYAIDQEKRLKALEAELQTLKAQKR